MRIFITGASGLVGKRLIPTLTERGDTVVALSRKAKPSAANLEWLEGDPCVPGPWLDRLADCDAVVHLAGEPIIGKRWNDAFLKKVRDSRVDSTRLIAERLAKGSNVKVFVSGSAVGFYGMDAGDAILTEDSPGGTDVLGTMTRDWEAAADPAKAAGVRVAHPRTGIVLDREGGALPNLARPFKLFAGGRMGSGRHFLPWIHHADMTGLLLFALDNPNLHGPFNATGPIPVRNEEFSRELGRVLHRPSWLPAPRFMLRIVIGKAAEMIVGSLNAVPRKAQELGYQFKYVNVGAAMDELFQSSGR